MGHMLMSKDTMFSVRETPWHRLGTVLQDYPTSIDDALEKSGLSWKVKQGSVMVAQDAGDPLAALSQARALADAYTELGRMPEPHQMEALAASVRQTPALTLADEHRANLRADDGAVLGIVSDDYKVVQNREAFQFLDALIGSDLHFETAGSLMNGKRVWVLARLPEWVEIGGDQTAAFVYITNAHDGTMAVTSTFGNVRIVCWNTLSYALAKAERYAERVYKFRHTGDLAVKFDEARKVMGLTINYAEQFKALGDQLARQPMSKPTFENKIVVKLIPIDEDQMGKRAITNRKTARAKIIDIFNGRGPDGDTMGNSPGTKWCAVNAVGEYSDWCRRYTKNTDQMHRSFEDHDLKQRALDLIVAA